MQTHRGIQRILVLVSVIWVLLWSARTFDVYQVSEKEARSQYIDGFGGEIEQQRTAVLQDPLERHRDDALKAWNNMGWRERRGWYQYFLREEKKMDDIAKDWLLGNALGLTVIWGVYFSISWVVAGFRST